MQDIYSGLIILEWQERQAVLTLSRLHGLRGERSNVPRDSAALYEAGEDVTTEE